MKERLAPHPDTPIEVQRRASTIISWGAPGHEKEYLVNLPGLIDPRGDKQIPTSVSSDIQDRMGSNWVVSNRGTRLELTSEPYGIREDKFVVSTILAYFDELSLIEAK